MQDDNDDIFFQSDDAEVEEAPPVPEDQRDVRDAALAPKKEQASKAAPKAPKRARTPKAQKGDSPTVDVDPTPVSTQPAAPPLPFPPTESEAGESTPESPPEPEPAVAAAPPLPFPPTKSEAGESTPESPPEPEPAVAAEPLLSKAEAEAALESLTGGVEALVFASGSPLTRSEIRKVFAATWRDFSEDRQAEFGKLLTRAFERFAAAWGDSPPVSGFELLDIGGGWVFRTASVHSSLLRALRTEKPVKLSRAALEVLSVVAYRQPTTKAEVDYVRGVDCGGTLRGLLDRGLVKIVGKKEEPGRPLLYGTTHRFLSLFNLGNLRQLPTLREYHELSEDSAEKVREFDGFPSVEELKENMVSIAESDDSVADDLEVAVVALGQSEDATRTALAAEGISLLEDDK